MAITVAELNARLTADTKDFKSGMDKAEKQTDGFGGKLQSSMGTMAKWGAAAAAAGATAAVAFGVKAVMAASDLEESISKVNTVFDENAGAIQAWSKTTASSIGLPRTEALAAVGDFGNMFDQLGIGSKESAKMSTSMVELAADFASFHNADISEVINAQSSAFRGEYDALQRFLPLINAASVEQKALEMTGKKTTKELTQQDKALAVNALMMSGAGEAAGDFERTQGGLANQMRILKAQATDFAANVGTHLIPIVLKGIELFREWVPVLKDQLQPAFETVRTAIDAVVGFISDLVGKFQSGQVSIGDSASKLKGIWDDLQKAAESVFGAVQVAIDTAVKVVTEVWRTFGDDILEFATEAWNGALGIIDGVLQSIRGVFDIFKSAFTGDWKGLWEGLKTLFGGLWNTLFEAIKLAVFGIGEFLLQGGAQALKSAWNTLWNGLKTLFDDIWDNVIFAGIKASWGVITRFFSDTAPGALTSAAKGMWGGITGAFKSAVNAIIDVWNSLEFKLPGFKVGPIGYDGFTLGVPDIPKFHDGGIVPGPRGADVPIMAQAGERVIPAGGGGGMGGYSGPQVIQLVADGRVIQEILLGHQRRSGALGFN